MELTFYYNGEFLKSTELHVSAYDQGFLYGEGFFEPMMVRDRKMLFAQKHFDRFLRSAETLGMNLRMTETVLEKTVSTLLDINHLDDAMVRMIATRGESSGYYYEEVFSLPSVMIMVLPFRFLSEKLYFMGVNLTTSNWRDIPSFSLPPDVRSLSFLNRRTALREAREKACFDALFINMEGYATQCSGANIFLVRGRALLTPCLASGIYPGVTREHILYDAAREFGMETSEGFILQSAVYEADECFITSTEAGVLPVISCDDRRIGNGRTGRMTRQMQEFFMKWYKK